MSFAENLNYLLKDVSISQNQLAQAIGYSQRAVSKWINGQAEPTETAIIKCATFFNVTTDFLLGTEDDFGIKKADGAFAPPAYSKEEQKIIEDYRRLNFMSKKLVLQTLATLQPFASAEEIQKKNKNG